MEKAIRAEGSPVPKPSPLEGEGFQLGVAPTP